jgi:hypothetical protein
MLFSSALKSHIMPFPSSRWVGHDWWISAAAFFLADPVLVNEPLARYRLHPEQTAGIGLAFKKPSFARKKQSLAFKIRREVQRIFRRGLSSKNRLSAERERTLEMSLALLKVLDACSGLNRDTFSEAEKGRIKGILNERLATLPERS